MAAYPPVLCRLLAVGITSFVLVEACASAAERTPPDGAGGASAGEGGMDGGPHVIISDVPTPPQGGKSGGINPLCGGGNCVPDLEQSCADFSVESGLDLLALAGAGGSGAEGGASGSSSGGSGGEAGVAGSAGAPGIPDYACRVVRAGRRPESACEPAGRGRDDAPCFSSVDCAAGFGCIDEGAVGRCRPFCCAGETSCDAFPGTHCGERALLEPTSANGQSVPVCVPADGCDLSKPPCEPGVAPGADCECRAGTACLVVRADGITTCATPGEGGDGGACPCQFGFLCAAASGTCLALCALDRADACPGRCQSSAELPDGWGVCIGR